MPLECRAACKDDLPRIVGFPRDPMELYFFMPTARFPLTLDVLEEMVAARQAPTVIMADGDVAGFADLYGCEFGNVCRIGNVVISPECRGRGAATALVRHMIGLAFEDFDARRVELACFNNNLAGLLLYPKLGFRPFEIESRVGPSGERLALIQFRLYREGEV